MARITEADVLNAIRELTTLTEEQVEEAHKSALEIYVFEGLKIAIFSTKALQTEAVRDALVAMAKDAQTPFIRTQALDLVDSLSREIEIYPEELVLTLAETALDDPSADVRLAALNIISYGHAEADRNRKAAAVAKAMGDEDKDFRQSASITLKQITMELGITAEYWEQTLKPVFTAAAEKHNVALAEIAATADEIAEFTDGFWGRFGPSSAPYPP